MKETSQRSRNDFGRVLGEYGRIKKLRLFNGGFEYAKGGTVLAYPWSDVDRAEFFWEATEFVGTGDQSLQLRFVLKDGNRINIKFSSFTPLYGIGSGRTRKKWNEMLSLIEHNGVELRKHDFLFEDL